MPGGGFALASVEGTEFEAKITPIVIVSCIMAATGGLMFGLRRRCLRGCDVDAGFRGGVLPGRVQEDERPAINSNYCKYDNQGLHLFTSSLYLVGLISTFFASYTSRRLGRKLTMLIAGIFFIVGVGFNAGAQDLAMLIIGRILLGFANQAVPLFLSEIAPTRVRGGLNILLQLNTTIGILFVYLVNYGTAKIKAGWGWRLSLGLAGIPAVLLTVCALVVIDTPNSLVKRGRFEEDKAVLRRIKGTDNIEPEYEELVEASRVTAEVKHPFKNLLERRNRFQLMIAVTMQVFQQFTGIIAIMFYVPVLFNTVGFGGNTSLYSVSIIGAVNEVSTLVLIYSIGKIGRCVLLLEAGVQMFQSQVAITIAIILGLKVKDHSENLSHGFSIFVVTMVCTFVSGFEWSWGPLGWLIPSETFPLETWSAGQSVTLCVNFVFMFMIAQAFLLMLCHFKYGIFLFFWGWVVIMSVFMLLLLPETKNVPIEEMTERVWKKNWYWKRFIDEADDRETMNGNESKQVGAAYQWIQQCIAAVKSVTFRFRK